MKQSFLKKEGKVFCIRCSKDFYAEKAMQKLQEEYGKDDVSLDAKGRYYVLKINAPEKDALDALNYLLYFSKRG